SRSTWRSFARNASHFARRRTAGALRARALCRWEAGCFGECRCAAWLSHAAGDPAGPGAAAANSQVPMASRARRSKRPSKSRLALRWLGVAALCLVALLYCRPARTYLQKRDTVGARTAEVRLLRAEHVRLQRLVEASTSD